MYSNADFFQEFGVSETSRATLRVAQIYAYRRESGSLADPDPRADIKPVFHKKEIVDHVQSYGCI